VTTLAQAAEFACTIPWYTDTNCNLPKISIPPEGKLTIELYTVKIDGEDFTDPCPFFQVFDVNNDNRALTKPTQICAKTVQTYQNPMRTTDQVVSLRFNIDKGKDVDITGRYTVTK
jgi:hypothetical protein